MGQPKLPSILGAGDELASRAADSFVAYAASDADPFATNTSASYPMSWAPSRRLTLWLRGLRGY
jgi:hypothetical protein